MIDSFIMVEKKNPYGGRYVTTEVIVAKAFTRCYGGPCTYSHSEDLIHTFNHLDKPINKYLSIWIRL